MAPAGSMLDTWVARLPGGSTLRVAHKAVVSAVRIGVVAGNCAGVTGRRLRKSGVASSAAIAIAGSIGRFITPLLG